MDKLHLVTGYKGEEHIQSADQGSFNASFFGGGEYVMEAGNQFEASIMDNNTVRILDGDALMKGRHLRIEPNTYADVSIQTGTAGVNRNDLIVFQYVKDSASGVEDSQIVVIKGTETEGTATDPEYTDGDILGGATFNQMPMYRVKVEGVVLTGIEPLFTVIPTYKKLAEMYARQFQEACDTYIGLLNILDTMEEVEANTQEGQLAGALALKELAATKVTNNFNPRVALATNADGKVSHTGVTLDELNRLSGVTSGIQNQLNNKLPLAGGTLTGDVKSQNLYPQSANTKAVGVHGSPYNAIRANSLISAENDITYASLSRNVSGTTDTTGIAMLNLGNSTPVGTNGNARGWLRVFNRNSKYCDILANDNMTDTASMTFSSKSGTIPTITVSGTEVTINL